MKGTNSGVVATGHTVRPHHGGGTRTGHGGKPLQLNVVAQHASVGVGTVYRHVPTPEALAEALAADQIDVLVKEVDAAPRTLQGLRNFLKVALTVFLRDDTSASALINPVTDDLRRQRRRLLDGLCTLIVGIIATDPLMFPALGPRDIILLLCGVGSAMRLSAFFPAVSHTTLPTQSARGCSRR